MNSNIYNYGLYPLLVIVWATGCITFFPFPISFYLSLLGGIIIASVPVEILGWVK